MADTLTSDVSPKTSTSARSALMIVFLVVFIDLLGFGIVLPLLPLYGKEYVGKIFPDSHAGLGGAILGLLMASFSAMQFLFAPVWGRVSDRVGRRPILLIGLAGSVAFYTLFGYASDMPRTAEWAGLALGLIFLARLGAGIAGATIATAQAVIADCTPPEKRRHGMALIGAAFGIGFTFGPLIGAGALKLYPGSDDHGPWYGLIGYVAASLSFAALVLGIVLMPETRRSDSPPARRRWFDGEAWRMVFHNPSVAPVVLTFFLATLGFASFEVTLALMNRDTLGLPEEQNYLVFAYVGFVLMLTQGGLYRPLARRFSEVPFMALGIALMGSGVLCLAGVTLLRFVGGITDFGTLLGLTLFSLTTAVVGFAFLTPSAQALVSRRSDPERQGEILGVNQSAAALARILGPIFGVLLYSVYTPPVLPYVFGGSLVLAMLPLIPRIRRGGADLKQTAV